jgi:phosphatidylglycerol:prolipoprotein diacylglycerol transferase
MGGLVLAWHGLLTFVAVALAVFLVAWWGSREGISADAIYSVAVWAIIGGVIGARLVFIIDFWGEVYKHDPVSVLYVWEGGIAIYGAILGGFVGGALYIIIRNSAWFLALWGRYFRFLGQATRAPLPTVGRLADIAAPAMLIAQAIGRVGDIINGEHCASATSLPWGVIYTHPDSAGITLCGGGVTHPAVAYELLMDLVILGILWPLRRRLRPDGMFFALYLGTYSLGRFFLSFLRVEFNEYFLGLNEAQIIALVVMAVTIPLVVYKARLAPPVRQRRTDRRRLARR